MPSHVLSTTEIRDVFAEVIEDAHGTVSETCADGDWLFARSLLPWVADVRPNDRMQGGVALRASAHEICLHPYVFRLVCKNGAIRAHAIESRHIDLSETLLPEVAAESLREAVRDCCMREAFTAGIDEARTAIRSSADLALEMLPILMHMNQSVQPRVFREILSRFMGEADRSRFGLMNAVTSVARDTRDQDTRWRLEELGGGVPVLRPTGPATPSHFATFEEGELDTRQLAESLPMESWEIAQAEWMR
jgi:hypothetical protein